MEKEIIVTGFSMLQGVGGGSFASEDYEQEPDGVDTGAHELNRAQKIMLAAFLKAQRCAGLESKIVSSERAAIFIGNSYGIDGFKADFFRLYKKSNPLLTSPSLFPFTTPNSLAAWLAIPMGIKGPNTTFVSGCNASSHALLAANDAISSGECDIAFVGGVSIMCEDLSDEFAASGFKREVIAFVVLESRNLAESSGRKPYGRIKGFEYEKVPLEKLGRYSSKRSSCHPANIDNSITEVSFLGNNLGEKVFDYSDDQDGNVFDVAGVLSVIRALSLNAKSIRCSSVDSSGSVIRFILEKV